MPTPDFAVALIADPGDPRALALLRELSNRTADLPRFGEKLEIVKDVFPTSNGAAAAVFFDGPDPAAVDPLANRCMTEKLDVFPVVASLRGFTRVLPKCLHPFNGFALATGGDVGELAGLILERLGLQRGRRKVFISYVRADTAAVAAQLQHALTARWYTVFHDTVSIRPGRNFQDELFEQLADSDVLLLLNSRHVNDRPFVQAEIEFAMQVGLGQVQVLMPGVVHDRRGVFRTVSAQASGAMVDDELSSATLADVLDAVAGERTALQRQREAEAVKSVEAYARLHGMECKAFPGRHIELTKADGSTVRLDVALGLPTSAELAMAWQAVGDNRKKQILYDPQGLTDLTADHLAFLGKRFPIQLLSYRDTLTWPVLS